VVFRPIDLCVITSTFFRFFYVFQNPKNVTFYVFLPCFIHFLGLWCLVLTEILSFMKFFGVKYFMKYFVKYFRDISKISRWTMGAGCIVHCNKVSKPVKGKYLLLCMNSIMYFRLISYTLIMFFKSFKSLYKEN